MYLKIKNLKKTTENGSWRRTHVKPVQLPAVLIADSEHAASVGDLNLS